MEHLAELHLTKSTEADNADLFYGLTRALDMNADKMMVELTFVKQLVYNATSSEGINITEGTMQMDYEYIEPLGRLVSETKNCKMISKQVLWFILHMCILINISLVLLQEIASTARWSIRTSIDTQGWSHASIQDDVCSKHQVEQILFRGIYMRTYFILYENLMTNVYV